MDRARRWRHDQPPVEEHPAQPGIVLPREFPDPRSCRSRAARPSSSPCCLPPAAPSCWLRPLDARLVERNVLQPNLLLAENQRWSTRASRPARSAPSRSAREISRRQKRAAGAVLSDLARAGLRASARRQLPHCPLRCQPREPPKCPPVARGQYRHRLVVCAITHSGYVRSVSHPRDRVAARVQRVRHLALRGLRRRDPQSPRRVRDVLPWQHSSHVPS